MYIAAIIICHNEFGETLLQPMRIDKHIGTGEQAHQPVRLIVGMRTEHLQAVGECNTLKS